MIMLGGGKVRSAAGGGEEEEERDEAREIPAELSAVQDYNLSPFFNPLIRTSLSEPPARLIRYC